MDDDRDERAPEAGSTIGNRGEPAAETIPGGIRDDDERVAAHDTQSSGAGSADRRIQARADEWPANHREGDDAGA